MRHFGFLDDAERARLFHCSPVSFDRTSDPATLAVALGATLYAPATRPALARDVVRQAAIGVTSMVLCLEDGIADEDVPEGERNVVAQLRELHAGAEEAPLLFIRVRAADQVPRLVAELGDAVEMLSGFVVPKFGEDNGIDYLEAISDASEASGARLLAMPVLESGEIIHQETRREALVGIGRLLDKHRERVLAVRVGATDLCAAYGLRRPRELTIYDVHLVAEVIADIVNVMGRADGSGFVVTGPVWEYFTPGERMFKPQLRTTPFAENQATPLRQELLASALDGLIREVVLDHANGLLGKTVIHPTHVAAVHALSVVSHEDYADASAVLGSGMAGGGVQASAYGNKMLESKPHRSWALRTLQRAEVFGVAAPDVSFVDLLNTSVSTRQAG